MKTPSKPRNLAATTGRLVYDSRRDAPRPQAPEPSGPPPETRRQTRPITRAELARWSGFAG